MVLFRQLAYFWLREVFQGKQGATEALFRDGGEVVGLVLLAVSRAKEFGPRRYGRGG